MIPYGRQEITQSDVEAVIQVLRSDFLTQGPVVPRFERTVAEAVGADHAVAVNSATSALHLACLALGVGPGDYVWTSPITFVASANCALYCRASVDFVDIDPRTYNLSVEALARKLDEAEAAGKLPKVVIPVHLCGQPCDMQGIYQLSRRYGFRIIEDASHAIGGSYKGRRIGSCEFSDITIFSFHPVKIVTTGEGGIAVTNDEALAHQMGLLRSHGITRDPAQMSNAAQEPWYYEQVELGFNYRMTELQGALGVSQMQRLSRYVERRHELAAVYDSELSGLPVITPWQDPVGYSAYHLYVIRLQSQASERGRRMIFEQLRSAGIGVNVHYIPVHTQPYYQSLGFTEGSFPEAERYYAEAISLPMFPTMSEVQQADVVSAVKDAVSA